MTDEVSKAVKTEASGREWLNPASSADTGSIQWSAEFTYYEDASESPWFDASFTLADCNRRANIDLSAYGNTKSFEERMNKIKLLKDNVDAIYEFMLGAQEKFAVEYERNQVWKKSNKPTRRQSLRDAIAGDSK